MTLHKTYRIEDAKMDSYMLKHAGKMALGLGGGFLIFLVLIMIVAMDVTILLILLKIMGPIYIVIALIMGMIGFASRSIPSRMRYTVSSTEIAQFIEEGDMGAFSRYNMNRADRKSGYKRNQHISIKNIESLKIKDSGIVVKSYNYSMWSGNGKIVIPCEVNDYDQIAAYMRTLKKQRQIGEL